MISDWVLNFEKSPTSPMSPATETTPRPFIDSSRALQGMRSSVSVHLRFDLGNETVYGVKLGNDMFYVQGMPAPLLLCPLFPGPG